MSDINANQPLTLTDRLRIIFADVIDPLVTFLARIGVTPNALTISGVILHIPVAYFLTQGQWRLASLMGLISLADALDGSLARKLGTSESNFGAFLDSTQTASPKSSSSQDSPIFISKPLTYYPPP